MTVARRHYPRRLIHFYSFSAWESLVQRGNSTFIMQLLLIRSVGRGGRGAGSARRTPTRRAGRSELLKCGVRGGWGGGRRRRGERGRGRCRVSHLDARLEIIPLGHFLVLCRGNFSPSAQLLLGVVQVKDRHRVQPALEYQARQVLNVVLPAGKSTQILVGSRDITRSRLLRLPRPGRSCNAAGRDRTSWRAISARHVVRTFRDRPGLARAAVPAASYGSFELDTRRNESWDTRRDLVSDRMNDFAAVVLVVVAVMRWSRAGIASKLEAITLIMARERNSNVDRLAANVYPVAGTRRSPPILRNRRGNLAHRTADSCGSHRAFVQRDEFSLLRKQTQTARAEEDKRR